MPSDAIMVDGWGGDESNDCPEDGISPVTPQEGVPLHWSCPKCRAGPADFDRVEIRAHSSL